MDDAHGQTLALPFRVYGLEGRMSTVDDAVQRQRESAARLTEALGNQGVTLAKHEEQIQNVNGDVALLAANVNKLIFVVLTFAFAVAASAVGISVTIAMSGT